GFGEAFASTGAERTWVLEHRSAAKTKPKPEIGGRPGLLRYRRWGALDVGPQELQELLTAEQWQLDGVAAIARVDGNDAGEGLPAGSSQIVSPFAFDVVDGAGERGAGGGVDVQLEARSIGVGTAVTSVSAGRGVFGGRI